MIKEFEGKTETEAIENAVQELGLSQDEFEVEIVNSEKGFLFKKGMTTIKVHYDDVKGEQVVKPAMKQPEKEKVSPADASDLEKQISEFLKTTIEKMGYSCSIQLEKREDGKLVCNIETEDSAIIIGRKGKNLDALQLLTNVFAGKLNDRTGEHLRVVVDTEDYRIRREENLIRMAEKAADQVIRSKKSRLLEPMNPFERRLVHTALNENHDILTKSEGDGLFKQIRIIYKGSR